MITQSVVRSSVATEVAFCSAERVTLVGSTMPAAIRSQYSSVESVEAVLHALVLQHAACDDGAVDASVLGDRADRHLVIARAA